MKLLLLSVLLVDLLFSFDYKLQPKKVSRDEIYCFFGHSEVMDEHNNGDISNSCFVNMGSSYLVIDSGSTYSYALQAYEKIKKIKNLPVSYVVNTHIHDDHWLGNSYFITLGAKIIGSSAFQELPIEKVTRMQRKISAKAFEKTKQIHPTIFVEKKKVLDFDNQKVYIRSVNHKAHTQNDLYVYIPSKNIVFVGDLVFNDRVPSLRDGNLQGCLDALDMILLLDVDFIVGGHGQVITRSSVTMTYNYIKELKTKVSLLIEEGVEIGEVVNLVKMKKYKNLNLYNSLQRQNVEIAYRLLEWENE